MANIRRDYADKYSPSQKEVDTFKASETLPVIIPDVDIFEDEKSITLLAEMPGVSIANLSVDVKDDKLTLSGKMSHSKGGDEESLSAEYPSGRYHRSFKIPLSIDPEGFEARLTNGLLTLKMKRREKRSPRKIEIKAS